MHWLLSCFALFFGDSYILRWQSSQTSELVSTNIWDLKVPSFAAHEYSDIGGGLVRASGRVPVDSILNPVDMTQIPSETRKSPEKKPVGLLHLFESEAAWKMQKSKTARGHPRPQKLGLKNVKLNSPSAPKLLPVQNPSQRPIRRAIMASPKPQKRHVRKRLSTVTLLRALENSILIKQQGHFPDERELQSLQSTSKGLR
jgi:hypothetical protein